MLKAIFLDLDNTLIDRDYAFQRYIQDFFIKHNQALATERLQLIKQFQTPRCYEKYEKYKKYYGYQRHFSPTQWRRNALFRFRRLPF